LKNKRPLVIYHGNCADGFSAAWCFWRKYGLNADYVAGVYSVGPPDVTGRDVYLVDFSYRRAVIEEMMKSAYCITLIDHHKSALADLAGVPIIQFTDLDRSGAGLAWDFLFPNDPRPLLLNHVEDRDLWRLQIPGTRAIQSTVFSYEYTFENWDTLMGADSEELARMAVAGASIERKQAKDIAELLKVCKRTMTIAGHTVPVASLPYTLTSDAGEIMAKGEPFAACYWDTATHRCFSLRSNLEGLDVSLVAGTYGGGGHRNAAGFRVLREHALAIA
jgi:uncharacterized protein